MKAKQLSAPFLAAIVVIALVLLKLTSRYEGLVRSTGLWVCSGVLSLGTEPERAKRINKERGKERPKLRPFFFSFEKL